MIRVSDIQKHFGALHVLRGISFEVQKGEAIVIIGPSGSGKSTLLRCINLLVEPDSGQVFIDGVQVNRHGIRHEWVRQQVGMVFQSFNLFTHLSAIDNVTLGLTRVKGMPPDKAIEKARELLARVGLAAKENSYPAELSGGQQQRVAIARALAMDPRVPAILYAGLTIAQPNGASTIVSAGSFRASTEERPGCLRGSRRPG